MSTYEEQSGPRPYMLAASPLAVAALLGPLLEANLRDAVGEASSAQIATGVAAIPGALVAVWLTQRSRRRDAYTGRSVPTSDQVSLSKATRLLLIIAAAVWFHAG